MVGKRVIEEKPIPLAEVKEILEKRAESTEELIYEQKVTLDYVRKFVKIDKEKAYKMIEELLKLEKVTLPIAVKIADLLPEDADDLRVIFAKERFTLTQEDIDKILSIVSKYK